MLSTIESVNSAVNNFIWGVPAMICIIGVGLYLSIRTDFLQIRKFPYAMKVTIGRMLRKRDASDGALTPFQAVCTALAATVGTGNITGVAAAKYRRGCRSNRNRRAGRSVLDVDLSTSWNVYKVFRSYSCSSFP